MGRFSKLEPNQPRPAGNPDKAPPKKNGLPDLPALSTRLEPGSLGAASADDASIHTAGEWVALGDQAFLRGDTKPALRWYSRALDRDTTLADGWVAMIRVLLFRGDLGQAETWTSRALQLFPNSGSLLAMRAVVFARKGMLRQALNNSDAILAENATNPTAQIARGEVLLLADNKNAEFCFNQAMTLVPPGDWKTPATIATIHEERRLWARAIHFYILAAGRNESNAALWYRIALCRAELGHRQQARQALLQAHELCPPGDPLIGKIERASTGSLWNRMVNFFKKK